MPRLLPRLVRALEKHTHQPKNFPFCRPIKNHTKSLYKPPREAPSFHPSHHERSILLATPSPVCDTRAYVRHKRRPPNSVQNGSVDKELVDPPRQMSDREREWWANPYLRMLSSPLRTCILTNRTLPSDLLIRLVGMRVPSAGLSTEQSKDSVAATLAPDGILHPKYVSRKVGGGAAYILCWRKAIENLQPGSYKRIAGRVLLPRSLSNYIAHLLRLRVLQELELLTERLEWAMRHRTILGDYAPILRRLSKAEWGSISTTGTIPCGSAVAVLVAPRPNRDRVTKERPRPSMSARPPEDEKLVEGLPPVSVLMPNSTVSIPDETGMLPPLKIPLYNSITAFPSRSQRATLYDYLTRILAVERFHKRLRGQKKIISAESPDEIKENSGKGSHAFILCSNKQTVRKADSAAVALALWRLGMYESEGWALVEEHC